MRELLAALSDASALSGEALARTLGVTRAAVWKQIERLREAGVAIDAVAGLGYRLAQPVALLDAARIRRALAPATRARLASLEVAFEIDSTNAELLRRAADDARSGTVLYAERQTAGRGRRGRAWHSPLGANLYVSVLWRFEQGLAALSGLSLAVGVALARLLRDLGAADVAIKWPNDLVRAQRKLGGILVEAGGEANGPCHAVIGVGLNLRMPATAVIDQPWCDLASALGAAMPSRDVVAARLLDALIPALAAFADDGGDASRAAFAAYDALAGVAIDVIEPARRWPGIARGIDALGRLQVDDARGIRHALGSGEVSVRRGRGATP